MTNMNFRPVKLLLGLIGVGNAGQLYVDATSRLSDTCAIAAVVDPHAIPGEAWQKGLANEVKVFGSASDLINSLRAGTLNIDACIVASPDKYHLEHARLLINNGIPCLIEKPLGARLDEAERFLTECKAMDTYAASGYLQRFVREVNIAIELMKDRRFGELKYISLRHISRYEVGSRPSWFLDPGVSPMGIIGNIGSHAMDRLVQLSGEADAEGFDIRSDWVWTSQVPVSAKATIRIPSRKIVSHLELLGRGGPVGNQDILLGDQGMITIATGIDAAEVTLICNGSTIHRERVDSNAQEHDPVTNQLNSFIGGLRGTRSRCSSIGYGVSIMKALNAIAAPANEITTP